MMRGRQVIFITLLVALILEMMPMSSTVSSFRPDWVLLVLCYWTLALPTRVNVGIACLCGVILDVLLGTVMGVHGLAMSLVVFVMASNYQRFRNYSVWQQAFIVGVVSALYQLVVFWTQHLLTDIYFLYSYLWPVVFNMVFWIWVFPLMRRIRRHYRVK
ncbi:rod shape-determining protein MreD [Bowmanella sp. JS7-9]|uniref:Rod shape-determining protein MreD n=1 Tax=Pseudobowmanella zhangzhouensis TaxID=1537679 RepID=A0ABW1XNI7_9ALTE|nr:rod shape-determining protein MreD [Bowmanella sp. JS7-9]TBX21802.1 rod shape-determining protein MreD [Bowmanella sp. JS7-9]